MNESTQNRLKQIMNERNLKQRDILEMSLPYQKKYDIKMGKSALSQYVNGKSSPDQHKLFLLGTTLGVDEAWLMGFDVPRERQKENQSVVVTESVLVSHVANLIHQLAPPRQKKVYKFAEKQLEEQNVIANISNYKKEGYLVHVNGLLTAGHGSINFDKEQPFASVTVEYAPKDYDLAFEIAGDSMFPTFQDGEIVFVQRLQAIYNGMLAAIEINNEAFIKKVYLEGNRIRLVSLNTDLNDVGERLYPDFYADEKDDIHMIGRVLT